MDDNKKYYDNQTEYLSQPNQLRSALFVDFDNIFLTLQSQDNKYAQSFATNPEQWLNWLERMAFGKLPKPMRVRRLLIRKCYLNPQTFYDYRPYFIKGGFDVVDCPPLTRGGKTSADIHMVMDILEALNHTTHFDEFVVFSGDADFTPVLIKLREHDRRSVVLSMGYTSPAYKASATGNIYPEVFVRNALKMQYLHSEPAPTPRVVAPANTKQQPAIVRDQDRREATEIIRNLVDESDSPISFDNLTLALKEHYDDNGGSPDWLRGDLFPSFVTRLDLAPLVTLTDAPGFVYDPDRHQPPTGEKSVEDIFGDDPDELAEVARKVTRLTDTPMLSPDVYRELFGIIADEVNANDFRLHQTTENVLDKCRERDLPVTYAEIMFILSGISNTEYDFKAHRPNAGVEIAKAFAVNTNALCRAAQYDTTEDIKKIILWLVKR